MDHSILTSYAVMVKDEMYLLWLRVAAILYAAAGVAVFPAVLYKGERWRSWCVHLGGLALLFHFVSVVEMLAGAHRWLPMGVREVQSLLGLAVVSVFFLVWWLYDAISLGLFALPVTFFMVLIPSLGPDRYTFPSEGVRVSWLVAHIAALLVAYAALGFSLLASILYLLQERRLKAKPKARFLAADDSWWAPLDWLPPLDTLERISEAMLEFGFPCMTVGLVIGAVLVQETSLGAAYFLDPKIIAAFVSWAIYVLLLLVRRTAGLRGRRAAYLSGAVFAVMIVVWTANLFSHVHRFGAP
ncbi:MAG: cytochrome c biogenesis protein CcsA [Terracidiphilus sp.]